MKRLFTLGFIVFCAFFLVQSSKKVSTTPQPVIKAPSVETVSTVEAADKQNFALPLSLSIDSISLHASITAEGLGTDGLMVVPADNKTIGWWKYGPKPGESGNVVLAGHFRVENGTPGVFFNLKNVKVGKEIKIKDEVGRETVYKITKLDIYKVGNFPTKEIYEGKTGKELILITCSGKYIKSINNYTDRLVVTSELIQ